MLRFGNIYKLWTCSVLQYKYRCSLSRCKPAAVSILLPAVISMLLFLKIHVANGKQQHQQVCRQATCMLKMSSYTNKLAGLTFSILMPRLCQFSARTRLHACKTCALMTLFYRNTVLFSPAKNWCKLFEFSNYSKNLICKIFDEDQMSEPAVPLVLSRITIAICFWVRNKRHNIWIKGSSKV